MPLSRFSVRAATAALALAGFNAADAQVTRYLMPATNQASIDCSTPAVLDGGANSVTYL